MLPGRRQELRTLALQTRNVVFWAAVVGIITGLLVSLFERVTFESILEHILDLPLPVVAFAPMIGLAISAIWLRWVARGIPPMTSDAYIIAFHARGPLSFPHMIHRVVASVATLGFGNALGPEGPSLYMGATIGSTLQQRFGRWLSGADPNLLLVAGAAAGVAAIFKAPATGAVFAIEVPYQDDLARHMLLPSLVSAAAGYLTFVAVNDTTPLFPIRGEPPFSFADLAGAAVLGVLSGFGARGFAWMLRKSKRIAERAHPLARVAVVGVALAAIFAATRGLTGESLSMSPGANVVSWALDPEISVPVVLALLVLRCFATTASVAGGGVGGLFVPLVVAGALLGRAVGGMIGELDTTLFLVVGIAAFLGAGYRTPLAAVMFVAEVTGRPGFVVPGVIAAVAGELVMLRSSVTEYQARPSVGVASR